MIWHTEARCVRDIIFSDCNPRRLTTKQHKDLTASIKKFDLVEIPVINTDNRLLAGQQRIKILLSMGRGGDIIDVRVPDRKLTPKECEEYLIRSNKNRADWDFDLLLNNFNNVDLESWGFEKKDFGIEVFGDTSTDRGKQGVNSTWEAVKTTDKIKIIIGQLESSIPKELAIKIIQHCETEFEKNNTPIKNTIINILENGINNLHEDIDN
jgi:hypothetical protein